MVNICTIVLSRRKEDEEAKSAMVRIKEKKSSSFDTIKMFKKQCIWLKSSLPYAGDNIKYI